MKRLITMLVATGMMACLTTRDAHAQGSMFVRITPEIQEEYNVYVQILPVEGQKDKYKIMPPRISDVLSIYLITCREPVPPKKQNFRAYIWSDQRDRTDVMSVAPLLPPGRYRAADPNRILPAEPADIILDKFFVARSYLYIDFPHPVDDGGYYYCIDLATYPLPEDRKMGIRYSPAEGLGPEAGMARQDPSDVIKARVQYYLWYVKGKPANRSDVAIWYATSADGHTWVEKGEALSPGSRGSWDAGGVFAPNILVAEHKFWLFYTGVPESVGGRTTKIAIGIAVADGPDGPWQRLSTNPVVQRDGKRTVDPRVDDSSLIVRDAKYWLYYRSDFRWPADTMTGISVAVAEKPQGPYKMYVANPAIKSADTVLPWPLGTGVAAMIGGGSEEIPTLQYAPDGLMFSKMQDLDAVPGDSGAYRPEAFTDSGKGRMIEWGVHTGHKEGFPPFIERFDCQWQGF